MNTYQLPSNLEGEDATSGLRVLWSDGRWLPISETAALPVPAQLDLPGDAILQLVRRAKDGPTPLETILDAVRRQWNAAA